MSTEHGSLGKDLAGQAAAVCPCRAGSAASTRGPGSRSAAIRVLPGSVLPSTLVTLWKKLLAECVGVQTQTGLSGQGSASAGR